MISLFRKVSCISFFLILIACSRKLPPTIYRAYTEEITLVSDQDKLVLRAINPLGGPIRFTFHSSIPAIDEILESYSPQVLGPYEQLEIDLPASLSLEQVKNSIKGSSFWASLGGVTPDSSIRYQFPFPKGRSYPVMQAYNGSFSHQSDFSKYAIDFKIPIGDTICAAREGIVVGVIGKNEDWVHGPKEKYRPYANYLRIYHADETYSDYVHLKKDGILVALGDTVQAGQPVAIAGYTGWTTSPHLHFNAFMPTGKGKMIGIPIRFEKNKGRRDPKRNGVRALGSGTNLFKRLSKFRKLRKSKPYNHSVPTSPQSSPHHRPIPPPGD